MSKDNQKAVDIDTAGSTRFARKKVPSNNTTNVQSMATSSIQIKNQIEDISKTTKIGTNRAVVFPTLLGGLGDNIIFQDIAPYRHKPVTNINITPVKTPINITNEDNTLLNQPAQLIKAKPDRNRVSLNQNITLQQKQKQMNRQMEEKANQNQGTKEQVKKSSVTKETQTNSGSAKKIVERVVDVTVQEREAIDLKTDRSKKKIERKVQKVQRNRGIKFTAEQTDNTNTNDQTVNVQSTVDNKFSKVTLQTASTTVQPQKIQKTTIQPAKIQKTTVQNPTVQQTPPPNIISTTANQPYQRQNRYQGRPKIQSQTSNVQPSLKPQQKEQSSIQVPIKQQGQIKQLPKVPSKIERLSLKNNENTNEQSSTNQNVNQRTGQVELKKVEQKDKYKSITERTIGNKVEINQPQTKPEQILEQIKPKPSIKGKRTEINQQQGKKEQASKQTLNQLKSKGQQQKQKKVEQVKTILKKTSVIMLTVKRLVKNKLTEAFKNIATNSKNNKLHLVTQLSIFYNAMHVVAKNKQTNLLTVGFQTIKRKFITLYTSEPKSSGEAHSAKNINATVNFIDRLSLAKVRQAFQELSWKSKAYLRRVGPLLVVQRLTKKKQFQQLFIGFEKIRLRQLDKKNSLNKLVSIFTKVYTLHVPFSKLIIHTFQSRQEISSNVNKKVVKGVTKTQTVEKIMPDNQILIDKVEKSKAANASVTQEISDLESKIKEKKKKQEEQKKNKTQNIRSLQQQNSHLQTEINSKKQIKEQLKQAYEAEAFTQQEQLDGQVFEMGEDKLSLLINIYITNYKNSDQPLQPAQIASNFNLKQEDSSQILTEWQTILENTQLKRMIASYEKVNPKSYKSRSILLQEQALAHKLIRSYIKQQYFWQWIHLSATDKQ